jgi:hypothetical protein
LWNQALVSAHAPVSAYRAKSTLGVRPPFGVPSHLLAARDRMY